MRGWQDVAFLEEYGGPSPQDIPWAPKMRQELMDAREAGIRLLMDEVARTLGV
jgi:hypothetical protein